MSHWINRFRLTRNFLLCEYQSPDTSEVIVDMRLVGKVQALRDKLTRPVIITSGYRTPEHNLKVRGHINSRHTFGRAVDIIVREVDSEYVRKSAIAVGFDTVKYYEKTGHFHLDIGDE